MTIALSRRARPATAASAARRPSAGKYVVGIVSVVVVLALWQLSGTLGWIPVAYTSTPLAVLGAGGTLIGSGELGANVVSSLAIFAIGFGGGAVIGVPLGMLMGWRLRARQTFEPLVTAVYLTPSIVLLPIFVLALGIGPASKVAIVFIECVITIVVNSMAGIRETDPRLVRAARSFQASDWAIFMRVLLPSALPTIVAGLRLGVGRAVITVVVAELYGGTIGIGVLISQYGTALRIAPLMFLVILVGVFGYVASALLRRVEVAVTPWRRER